ncbi:hypothetical protein QEN19_001927 [Hanseniaspora menglaensis]
MNNHSNSEGFQTVLDYKDFMTLEVGLDVDFDTAYQLFEENFDDIESEKLPNDGGDALKQLSNADIQLQSANLQVFSPDESILHKPFQTPTNTENNDNLIYLKKTGTSVGTPGGFPLETPKQVENHFENFHFTPRTMSLLTNDTNSQLKNINNIEQNIMSPGFSGKFISNNVNGTETLINTGSISSRPSTSGSMLLQQTPDNNTNISGLMWSPSFLNYQHIKQNQAYKTQLPINNIDIKFNSLVTKSDNPNINDHNGFKLLTAKETDTIVNFLDQFDKDVNKINTISSSNKLLDEAPIIENEVKEETIDALVETEKIKAVENKKRKLSYDELQEQFVIMEKKLAVNKNRHRISEKKRRATINDIFQELTQCIRYPRGSFQNVKKVRVTKYKLLDYVIEDITAVLKNNSDLEVFINKIGKDNDFNAWLVKNGHVNDK